MNRWPLVALIALAPLALQAQPIPTLALAEGRYTLSLPYVEVGAGADRRAYGARLSAGASLQFVVDPGSIVPTPTVLPATDAATLAFDGTVYRLSLPYLEFTSAGLTKAYAASLSSSGLERFDVDLASVREVALRTAPVTGLVVAQTETRTVAGRSLASSSRLLLNWIAPAGGAVDHHEITAVDIVGNTRVSVQVPGSATSVTLTGLKSATPYSLVVRSCQDSACTRAASAAAVSATTPTEVWQLQGTGHTVATLLQPVADGNARLSATRFGPDAGSVANTVQFYYGPRGVSGLAVASSATVSAASPASYLSFTSHAANTGLRSPTGASSGIQAIMTGQGVPLSAALGAKLRLFFEANDADGRTRIYSVDSVDGYVGRDFNVSAAASTCTTSADYQPNGNCPATLRVGVQADGANGNDRLNAARQHKLAWPNLDDWRWDGAAGSFMVVTVDAIAGCTTATHNQAYAVWDGSRFVVQYASDGCPKLFKNAQAAVPMHLGGARYKLYFGDPSVTSGRVAGSALPFVGPKKLIYADGASTSAAQTVEFEDWETVAQARQVQFLWPDGEALDDKAEGYIDDFHVLAPTGSLDLQVLYLTITDGVVIPFAAAAVLLNP